jgi:hypothetical protein
MTCQKRDAHGRFTGSGKWSDPWYKRMYAHGYYYEKDQKGYNRQYYGRNRETFTEEYMGPCVCPRCERRGYAELRRQRNVKTGHTYVRQYLVVQHIHSEGGKTVYDGNCFVGVCPLGVSEN